MSVIRENTLVVDFSVLPKRPDANAVEKFMYDKLKLELADAINIQFHNVRNVVFIEMVDAETAWRYRNNHHLKHVMVNDKLEFRIPVYVEDDAVNVRVHDLPPRLPNTVLKEHLQPFGDIISINREVWKKFFPGKYNGVRVVRMRLVKPIPSYQTIGGEKTLVTYRNQTKTCKQCGLKSHPRQKCTAAGRISTPTESLNSPPFVPTDFPELSNQRQQKQQQKTKNQQQEPPRQQQQQERQQTTKADQNSQHSQCDDNNKDLDSEDALTSNNKRRLSTKSDENEQKRVAVYQGYQTDTQDENMIDEEESESSVTWSPPVTRGKNKKIGKIG